MELNQQLTLLIEQLIISGNTKDALVIIKDRYGHLSNDLSTTLTLNQARYEELQNSILNGQINDSDAATIITRIQRNILKILQERVPQVIRTKKILDDAYKNELYSLNVDSSLEKIIGSDSNLLKINWLEKGIKAAKSVCQIVLENGEKGTGFIIEGGFLITNFHVIPNAKKASTAKVIFDYEEDIIGNLRKTTEFKLDEDSIISSPTEKLDYARIKIIDDSQNPISSWGFVETGESDEINVDEKVVIIQHALGETKQIALTSNTVLGIKDKIYYTTDTQKGSSGSPVFNQKWKVIALHHAGKTLAEGGYQVVEGGTIVAANEGILIKDILEDIKKQEEEKQLKTNK